MRKKALLLIGLGFLIVFGIGIITGVLILNIPNEQSTIIYPKEDGFIYEHFYGDKVIYSDKYYLLCGYYVDGNGVITQYSTVYLNFEVPNNTKTATLKLWIRHYSIAWISGTGHTERMPLTIIISNNDEIIASVDIKKLEEETIKMYENGFDYPNYSLSYMFPISEINNTILIKPVIPFYDGIYHLEGTISFYSSSDIIWNNETNIYRPYLIVI